MTERDAFKGYDKRRTLKIAIFLCGFGVVFSKDKRGRK